MQVVKINGKVLCVGLWSKRFREWKLRKGPFGTWSLALGAFRIQWQLQRWI
jgi:hypothetical protein